MTLPFQYKTPRAQALLEGSRKVKLEHDIYDPPFPVQDAQSPQPRLCSKARGFVLTGQPVLVKTAIMTDVVVCETSVKLKKGDITAESTDAIVNLYNATLDRSDVHPIVAVQRATSSLLGSLFRMYGLDLEPSSTGSNPTTSSSTGVSKAILEAAGPIVKEECEHLAKLPNDDCVVTSAGNLECSKIIHLIGVRSDNIVTSVTKALKACDKANMATVSLPAMVTGNLKAERSIRLMMKGIEDYLNDPSVMTIISEIVIVVFEQEIYEKYQRFFQNYKKNYPHFSAFGKMIELIKGDITHQAVDCIVNLTNKTLNRSRGVSGAILSAAGDTVKEECKKIGVLQRDEVVITSGGKLESEHIMHIIGRNSMPAYEPSIDRILHECHKNGFTSVALPAIGTGMARVDVAESITAILNSILNYLSDTLIPSLDTIFIIVIQESVYKKYLEVFQAKSTELQALQREERIVAAMLHGVTIRYPMTWTDIAKKEFQEIIIDKTSQEYKDIKDKFFTTTSASKYEVTEIKRIQNITLWQSFTINKQAVNRKNPGQKNISHLYHGTHSNAITNINRDGFNRVYCGMNGTAYGNGTYFAAESQYSCDDRYSNSDANGNKYIYQAAVITGRYCAGKRSYKEAPHIDGDVDKGRYDSVVDNVENPKVFVVFHDDVAYPEYLITFKKRTS